MQCTSNSAVGQLACDWNIIEGNSCSSTWIVVSKRVGIIVEEADGGWTTDYTIIWEDGTASTHWAQEIELISNHDHVAC